MASKKLLQKNVSKFEKKRLKKSLNVAAVFFVQVSKKFDFLNVQDFQSIYTKF